MVQGSRKALVVAAVVVILTGASAAQAAEVGPRVIVRVTDHARSDAGDLTRARMEATRIFGDSGVRLEWAGIADGPQVEACDAVTVSVAFLSPALIKQLASQGMGETILGSASPSAGRAFVYSERVYARAAGTRVDAGTLLGRVMAHEIGHLLLGSHHERSGIMTAGIDTDPLGLRAVFSSREARAMRQALVSKAVDKARQEACGAVTVSESR